MSSIVKGNVPLHPPHVRALGTWTVAARAQLEPQLLVEPSDLIRLPTHTRRSVAPRQSCVICWGAPTRRCSRAPPAARLRSSPKTVLALRAARDRGRPALCRVWPGRSAGVAIADDGSQPNHDWANARRLNPVATPKIEIGELEARLGGPVPRAYRELVELEAGSLEARGFDPDAARPQLGAALLGARRFLGQVLRQWGWLWQLLLHRACLSSGARSLVVSRFARVTLSAALRVRLERASSSPGARK
jgi:hypothetical protein